MNREISNLFAEIEFLKGENMKLKLIDVKFDVDNDVTFGTCELCMSTGHTVQQPTFIFEKVGSGEKIEIQGYYWDWGSYEEVYVRNVIEFADWISKRDFKDDIELDYSWLYNLAEEFEEENKK